MLVVLTILFIISSLAVCVLLDMKYSDDMALRDKIYKAYYAGYWQASNKVWIDEKEGTDNLYRGVELDGNSLILPRNYIWHFSVKQNGILVIKLEERTPGSIFPRMDAGVRNIILSNWQFLGEPYDSN